MWLYLKNVTADDLSYGIYDLSLTNSKVKRIFLKKKRDIQVKNFSITHIEWLDWKGYNGEISYSNVTTISYLSTSENLLIEGSVINTIKSKAMNFQGALLNVTNSHIRTIQIIGLKLMGSSLLIEQTKIENLHQHAITVDIFTKVLLRDVNITKATSPAFYLPSNEVNKFKTNGI